MDLIQFFMVDVFAEKKYQGNQLAVFLNADRLSEKEMQSMARETNFAETSFILSGRKEDGGYDVRVFTPDFEVPFAGHPTLGTAYVIRNEIEGEMAGEAGNENSNFGQVILNMKVGQIPVTFDPNGTLWMKQKTPSFGKRFDPGSITEVLGINKSDIDLRFPVQEVSTGLGSIIVPLNSLDAVKRCRINHDRYKQFLRYECNALIMVFTDQTYNTGNTLNVRVFANETGYPEDAATGSANGNLASYLLEHDFFSSCKLQYSVEQGYEMGRPSLLLVKACKFGGRFDINIGGRVIPTARGQWFPL